MSKDKARREELANKFPEMDQRFQEIKSEINEPQIERLGETLEEQRKRAKNPT
ncbi:hypothetical protein Desde_1936 [Desulfitobacterium dehalogenans ATCC 51507]|uniref:Uncharacterized protein n=2 Tax=Desulfitobacterium dehalogenans TaxID=36854 RepID=I4A8P0_DESDJ|nr:hypothetical protein [Desulfitobacterium dehalogenans]AFM00325.1 hypothetical protein Desde_1936 [Desulfitobacterium dehalogenans ATCC 51507]HHY28529.1 hypothetical protein [Desulfitobacterium dehalogenans]